MLSQQDAKNIIDKVISFSKLAQCEVDVSWSEDASIRFAVNGITTSGYAITRQVAIRSVTEDNRQGTAVVDEVTDEALRKGVGQAEQLASISPPDPESMPALGPQKYRVLQNFDAFTGSARNDVMVPHVKAVIEAARAKQLTAAGFIQRSANVSAIGNKAGLFGYTTYTDASLSNTMRTAGGTSSGWASQSSVTLKDINGEVAGRIASEKCVRGALPKKKMDPGKYTVILEPSGACDLISSLGFGFGARQAEQGQSFLSKQGGGTRVGDKMFPDYITLRSDPLNNKLSTAPWGPSRLPNEPIAWIEKGVVKNLYYDRFWAGKAGKTPTPAPGNLVLDGQENSLEDLIKGVDKGLLITRLWYIRMLQPKTLQLTGLTRDGVFLIENGKVTDPVTNFRWNESPVRVLQNTQKITQGLRSLGSEGAETIAPALQVAEFNMASVSDAV